MSMCWNYWRHGFAALLIVLSALAPDAAITAEVLEPSAEDVKV